MSFTALLGNISNSGRLAAVSHQPPTLLTIATELSRESGVTLRLTVYRQTVRLGAKSPEAHYQGLYLQ
jgi:hypothetical protein